MVVNVPHGHWKTTTFLASLRARGLTAPLVVDGAINGAIVRAYVQQQLVPTWRAGDIVIMDNLSAHKDSGQLIDRFTEAECPSHFRHAGYRYD